MGSGATEANISGVAVACAAFQPIRWSSKDTRLTQDQATEHNAVYKKLCAKKEE